jgi:DNA-binding MarR family transcriptional regulator
MLSTDEKGEMTLQAGKVDRYITFSISIEQIAKNLQKLKNERMADFGLRSVHVTCLVRLGKAPDGLTGAELSECCEVDKSLISRVIGELEEKGYVRYEECGKKYRRKIYLTEQGQQVLNDVLQILFDTVDTVRGDVSEAELEVFYRVLNHFDQNICHLIKQTDEPSSIKY